MPPGEPQEVKHIKISSAGMTNTLDAKLLILMP